MTDVRCIGAAIEALTLAKLAGFRRWFAEFDAAAWDRQMNADSGRLDHLAAEAEADLIVATTVNLEAYSVQAVLAVLKHYRQKSQSLARRTIGNGRIGFLNRRLLRSRLLRLSSNG